MHLVVVALTVVALGTAGDAQAADWRPAVDVSAPQSPVTCGFLSSRPGAAGVDVAVDSRGNAVAAWTRRDDTNAQIVQAAFRPAGGSFGPPQDIGVVDGCYFLGVFGPVADVAIDDQGTAIVVWPGSSGANTVIQAAVRPPGGSFGPAQDLSDDSQNADSDPRISMSRTGHAVVVWTRFDGDNDVVQASTRAPGGSFSLPDNLSGTSPAGEDASSARVAVNDQGAVGVTWLRENAANDRLVQATVRPAGETFAPVLTLTGAGADASAPDIAIDREGRATVVWQRSDGTDVRIESRFLNAAGTTASGTDVLSDAGTDGSSAQVALDGDNNAVAVWVGCGSTCAIEAAARPSNGSFGSPTAISPPADSNAFPKVAMTPSGSAVAAWFLAFTGDSRIQTSVRPPGGSFGGVEDISPEDGIAVAPSIAVDDEGSTVAGWAFHRQGPDDGSLAQVAIFDAGAPSITGMAVPGSAFRGAAVPMAANAVDRFSGASLTWDFGDGTGGSGTAVSHAYAANGVYTVTVTARDAAGNARSLARTIQVTNPPPIDADGDGFPLGQDCDDSDPNIRPSAPEAKGNDVDENCDGAAEELDRIKVTLSHSFKAFRRFTRLTRIKVKDVPAGSKVRATCKRKKKGKTRRCRGRARRKFVKRNASGTVSLNRRYKRVKLPVGTRIKVRVTRPGNIGAVKILKVRRRKEPRTKTRCLPPGTRRPVRC